MSILDGFFSLGRDINKIKSRSDATDTKEGSIGEMLPELKLEMEDEELLRLKRQWEKAWSQYEPKIKRKQDLAESYWLGKQTPTKDGTDRPVEDNLIFEALETFLPIATRQNPEPIVETDNTVEGVKLADQIQKMLAYLADRLSMKLKIKRTTRFWSLYYLGVVKMGYNEIRNEIDMMVLRPQKLILDPDSTIDENGEYTGDYIGEYRREKLSLILRRFPNMAAKLKEKYNGKTGTIVQYVEWWTDEYVFWTLDDLVLDKAKNPHWNYPGQEETTDEFGNATVVETEAQNHFPVPAKPYVFLSIFNLGLHPHDDTSVIEQNLRLQDLINKRISQIDKNADKTNGGTVISGGRSGLTKEEAELALRAWEKGGGIYIPDGDPAQAVMRYNGQPLPSFIYESLLDYRNELRGVFGVSASTGQGVASVDTVRGKILAKGADTSRIGGGISEYIEQFSDRVFNWMVQLMYVYYTEPHAASILGKESGREYIALKNSDFDRKITVSVKEGSLIPRDPLTERNEAVDLWSAGALDPITLFDKLDMPNPKELAQRLLVWKTDPAGLFPGMAPQAPAGQPVPITGGKALQPPTEPGDVGSEEPVAESEMNQVPMDMR